MIENKGMKSECKKFGENSRETASVSTSSDEYCSPSQGSLHDSKHGEHTYRTKSSYPRAQLFEARLALNPGLNLTRISFSCVQKHFLSVILRASNHQLVDKNN